MLTRSFGHPADVVARKFDLVLAAPIQVVEADDVVGRLAGEIRAAWYDRTAAPISLADSFAIATASLLDARLATSDRALASVAIVEGVEVVPLPDTKGRLPKPLS